MMNEVQSLMSFHPIPVLAWSTDFGTATGNFSPVECRRQETEVLKPSDTPEQPEAESSLSGPMEPKRFGFASETSGRRSILVPETSEPSATNPSTTLKPIIRDNDAATMSDEDRDRPRPPTEIGR